MKMTRSQKNILASIAAVMLVILIGLFFCILKPLFEPSIHDGVSAANIPLGGKSEKEAEKTLAGWRQDQPKRTIVLSSGNNSDGIVLKLCPEEDIDFNVDVKAMAEAAANVGRIGNFKNRLTEIYQSKNQGYPIPLIIKYNETKLENILHNLKNNKKPENVSIRLLTREIIPEKPGYWLDSGFLRKQILDALCELKDVELTLPLIPIAPELTVSDLGKNSLKELVSVYDTSFNAGDVNRTANIKLAARKINGYVLQPGQVFSFNEIVGPRDRESGFKEAMEIVGGEFVPGIGGGVCQVSSTLYNAALLAGLEVIERSNHSRPLRYVPLGRDATVAYGSIDFKFVNSYSLPVIILAETSGNSLYVGILGRTSLKQSMEILTIDEKTLMPPLVEKEDYSLPPGAREVDNSGSPGYEVSVVRIIFGANRQEIKREIISRDQYLPENKIVRIGQGVR